MSGVNSTIVRGACLGLMSCAAAFAATPSDGISAAARQRGMQEAPQLIARSGISCHAIDARKADATRRLSADTQSNDSITGASGGERGGQGGAFSEDDNGGRGGDTAGGGGGGMGRGGGGAATSNPPSAEPDVYEIACAEGLGYLLLIQPKSHAIEIFSCPEVPPAGSGAARDDAGAERTQCLLAANQNQGAGMTPYLHKANVSCGATQVRGVGHNSTGTEFEVACANGDGYVLMASSPPDPARDVRAVLCAELPADGHVHCQLTDTAASLAIADQLIARSGVSCTVTDRRVFGHNAAGDKFYEVACQQGVGYVVKLNSDGSAGATASCQQLGSTAGGCQLAANASR